MTELSPKTLALLLSLKQDPFTVQIQGVSMNPTLHEGDLVLVQRQKAYTPGDILVYDYGEEGILIHRLLHQAHGLYYCRGDNAVRIERIHEKRILGKVLSFADGKTIPAYPPNHWSEETAEPKTTK